MRHRYSFSTRGRCASFVLVVPSIPDDCNNASTTEYGLPGIVEQSGSAHNLHDITDTTDVLDANGLVVAEVLSQL